MTSGVSKSQPKKSLTSKCVFVGGAAPFGAFKNPSLEMPLADMLKAALSFRDDEAAFLMAEFPTIPHINRMLVFRDILVVVWCSIVVVGFVKSVLKPHESHNSTAEEVVGDEKQMKKE